MRAPYLERCHTVPKVSVAHGRGVEKLGFPKIIPSGFANYRRASELFRCSPIIFAVI